MTNLRPERTRTPRQDPRRPLGDPGGAGARATTLEPTPRYRFARKLRENHPVLADCIDACVASLQEQYPDFGRDVAIDASDLPAYANGQRYVSHGGKERERFSDPDASWGHRSAISTRSGGGYYGYKIHAAVCVATGLPLAWRIETARRQESLFVAPLLDVSRATRTRTGSSRTMGRADDSTEPNRPDR